MGRIPRAPATRECVSIVMRLSGGGIMDGVCKKKPREGKANGLGFRCVTHLLLYSRRGE